MIQEFPKTTPLFFHPTCELREKFDSLPKQKKYSTHLSKSESYKILFRIAQVLITPWKETTKCFGRAMQPLPGCNKDHKIYGAIVQVINAIAFLIMLPIGIASLIVAFPFYANGHKNRPYISVIDNSDKVAPILDPKDTLDIRTYNLGFVYDGMSIAADLRPIEERATEIANAFMEEENSPDVICFQEAFSMRGTSILCETLKKKYPYIIHSVGPHVSGLNSGLMMMSKYPIEEVFYRRFNNLLGVEKLSSKGMLGIRINLGNGRFANVYDAHTQALLSKEKAEIRLAQLKQIVEWIDIDDTRDTLLRGNREKVGDFLNGDLNISVIDAWGYANPNERAGMRFLKSHFYDPFLEEHDKHGKRIKGTAKYLKPGDLEATGSWHTGPAAKKPLFLRISDWIESTLYGFKPGKSIKPLENPVLWGTAKWRRTANTARLDYSLVRKRQGKPHVKGVAEIEHVRTKAQSGTSDHLPNRALFQI